MTTKQKFPRKYKFLEQEEIFNLSDADIKFYKSYLDSTKCKSWIDLSNEMNKQMARVQREVPHEVRMYVMTRLQACNLFYLSPHFRRCIPVEMTRYDEDEFVHGQRDFLETFSKCASMDEKAQSIVKRYVEGIKSPIDHSFRRFLKLVDKFAGKEYTFESKEDYERWKTKSPCRRDVERFETCVENASKQYNVSPKEFKDAVGSLQTDGQCLIENWRSRMCLISTVCASEFKECMNAKKNFGGNPFYTCVYEVQRGPCLTNAVKAMAKYEDENEE